MASQAAIPLPVIATIAEAGIELLQLSSFGKVGISTPQAVSLKSVVVAAHDGVGAPQVHGEQPRLSLICSRWCCVG